MTSTISTSVNSTPTTPSPSSTKASTSLVKMANGEYTAASVARDPTAAAKLGLVKEKDGNYGTARTSQVAPTSTSSNPLPGSVRAAISALTLGGS